MDNQQNLQRSNNTEQHNLEPYGIDGWLILFLIGTILAIIRNIQYLIQMASHVDAFANGLRYIYFIAVLVSIIIIVMELAIVILMFQKNILFRTLFIYLVAFNFLLCLALPLLISIIYTEPYEFDIWALLSVAETAIWIIYLFRSDRVKNTFPPRRNKAEKGKDDNPRWIIP